MSIKINSLEIENVKRIKAVKLEPSQNGLTIIGGNNKQGKTSVLDAIAWGLGGNRFKPSEPQREGSVTPPMLSIKLSNGLVVERKGKNSELKVIDPNGQKAGQALLDSFIEVLALDLPRFMEASNKEKALTLLQIIGVGDQLFELEQEEATLYNKRHAIGQVADQKKKYADELIVYPEAPSELVSASELIKEQQEILGRNGENYKKREALESSIIEEKRLMEEIQRLDTQIKDLQDRLARVIKEHKATTENISIGKKTVEQLQDESTAEIEASIQNIEDINIKVRANLDKERANQEAQEFQDEYDQLTSQITDIRQAKIDLLKGADLPLPELSVEDGELIYQGFKWDNMSGADQLKVATAIIRKLKPDCGFVLIDKLEAMDFKTLQEFGAWLEKEGLQAIATRVSTGDECSVIIEDGYSQSQETEKAKWKAGEF